MLAQAYCAFVIGDLCCAIRRQINNMHAFNELKNIVTQANQKVQPGDRYYHYRNLNQLYKVLAIAIDEESNKPCVVYQAQYGDNLIWVRALSVWCELVDHHGKNIPRFIKQD